MHPLDRAFGKQQDTIAAETTIAAVSVSVSQRTPHLKLARAMRSPVERCVMTSNAKNSFSLPSARNTSRALPILDQPQVQEVLSRLYVEAEVNDAKILAEERAMASAAGGHIDDQTLASIREREFMAVAPEVGRLIYLLVRSRRPALVVEFGTSFGLSAIHIAGAIRDNGFGRLVTTEQSASKASCAAQHLAQAGLSDLVEIRQGDAFQTLSAIAGVDLLLLDGWKPLYLPLLRQLEPALSPGCLVIADDVISMSDKLAPYLAYVRDAANGYISCEIPLDDGLELSIR
jgi:predicted O-methyltransferase YrrM